MANAKSKTKSQPINAATFIDAMELLQSPAELKKLQRYFDFDEKDKKNTLIGVRMGEVFALAKEFMSMDLKEVEKLLKSPIHEVRAGAVSIMDFQA